MALSINEKMVQGSVQDLDGRLAVKAMGIQASNTDAVANTFAQITDQFGNVLPGITAGLVFNGTTWDRSRGTADLGTLITAAGATTTQASVDQTNYNHRGVIIMMNVSAIGTGSVSIIVDVKDTVSGAYGSFALGAPVTTNGLNTYTVYPGSAVGPNSGGVVNSVLGRTWRVRIVANNANPATYTVGGSLIL